MNWLNCMKWRLDCMRAEPNGGYSNTRAQRTHIIIMSRVYIRLRFPRRDSCFVYLCVCVVILCCCYLRLLRCACTINDNDFLWYIKWLRLLGGRGRAETSAAANAKNCVLINLSHWGRMEELAWEKELNFARFSFGNARIVDWGLRTTTRPVRIYLIVGKSKLQNTTLNVY